MPLTLDHKRSIEKIARKCDTFAEVRESLFETLRPEGVKLEIVEYLREFYITNGWLDDAMDTAKWLSVPLSSSELETILTRSIELGTLGITMECFRLLSRGPKSENEIDAILTGVSKRASDSR